MNCPIVVVAGYATGAGKKVNKKSFFFFLFLFLKASSPVCVRVQELCESRGGRPGLSVLTSLTVSADVKQH